MGIETRLKAWRQHLDMTQATFADATGVPLRTLKGYEMGERLPGCEALAAIAETGCNMTWLLTGKGEMRDVDRDKALPDGAFRVIDGEARPLTAEEQAATTRLPRPRPALPQRTTPGRRPPGNCRPPSRSPALSAPNPPPVPLARFRRLNQIFLK